MRFFLTIICYRSLEPYQDMMQYENLVVYCKPVLSVIAMKYRFLVLTFILIIVSGCSSESIISSMENGNYEITQLASGSEQASPNLRQKKQIINKARQHCAEIGKEFVLLKTVSPTFPNNPQSIEWIGLKYFQILFKCLD